MEANIHQALLNVKAESDQTQLEVLMKDAKLDSLRLHRCSGLMNFRLFATGSLLSNLTTLSLSALDLGPYGTTYCDFSLIAQLSMLFALHYAPI